MPYHFMLLYNYFLLKFNALNCNGLKLKLKSEVVNLLHRTEHYTSQMSTAL